MSLSSDHGDSNGSTVNLTSGTTWTDLATFMQYVNANDKLILLGTCEATVAIAAGDLRLTVNGTEVHTVELPVGKQTTTIQYRYVVPSNAWYTVVLQCRRSGTALASVNVQTGKATLITQHTTP